MVAVRQAASGCRLLRDVVLAAMLAACAVTASRAEGRAPVAEYQVKAAFLYKFLDFVEWPPAQFARPDSPLTIGVLSADALADELESLVAARTVHDRPVDVRKVQPGQSIAELHMLFVGRADSRVAEVLDSTRGRPLLTVTESDEGFARGSAINFVLVDNKVRFDVALRVVEQGHLKISSRLLAVARRVLPGQS